MSWDLHLDLGMVVKLVSIPVEEKVEKLAASLEFPKVSQSALIWVVGKVVSMVVP